MNEIFKKIILGLFVSLILIALSFAIGQTLTSNVNNGAAPKPSIEDVNLANNLLSQYGGNSTVNMLAFGDLLLDRYVRTIINRDGQEVVLQGVEGMDGIFFNGYDFVFANLEGPVTANRIATGKSIAFQFSPEFLKILTDHNFNIVSIANNHTYDMGYKGFEDTKKYLAEAQIVALGNAKKVDESMIYETETNGSKLAFIALNYTDFKFNIDNATELIEKLKSRNDFVIASIHWGVEYRHTPLEFQRQWAKLMINAGADVIIGHHPHVLQGMEIIDGRPVFYSLGNFVFDQWFSEVTQETFALKLTFNKANVRFGVRKLLKVQLVPIKLNKSLPYFPEQEASKKIMDNFYNYSLRTNSEIERYKDLFDNQSFEFNIS